MAETDAAQQWLNNLLDDIRTIQTSGIQPQAIIRRLEDIAHGRSDGRWREFRNPMRGKSKCAIEGGYHVITIALNDYDIAHGVWTQLYALRDNFKVITQLSIYKSGDHGSIRISIPVREL